MSNFFERIPSFLLNLVIVLLMIFGISYCCVPSEGISVQSQQDSIVTTYKLTKHPLKFSKTDSIVPNSNTCKDSTEIGK